MDVQGSELNILKNGLKKLSNCVAVQLEVSFICLYENQPGFGEFDMWMRSIGFAPHRFLDIKRWSITPTINGNNFRRPFNQLLEADIVYVRDPLNMKKRTSGQLKMLAVMSEVFFDSPDLAIHRCQSRTQAAAQYLKPAGSAKSAQLEQLMCPAVSHRGDSH
jgi:hypothetical protein